MDNQRTSFDDLFREGNMSFIIVYKNDFGEIKDNIDLKILQMSENRR